MDGKVARSITGVYSLLLIALLKITKILSTHKAANIGTLVGRKIKKMKKEIRIQAQLADGIGFEQYIAGLKSNYAYWLKNGLSFRKDKT
jgi:hypothetical protein